MELRPGDLRGIEEGSDFDFQFWIQLFLWVHLFGRLVYYLLRTFGGLTQ